MDELISQNPAREKGLGFGSVPDFYRLCEGIKTLEILNHIQSKQSSLDAMLAVGTAIEQELVDEIELKEYFFSCKSIADEIRVLTEELIRRAALAKE